MSAIRAIDAQTVHRIQSGQVIVDLCSVVKELVENSIDASATSIDVRFKNQGLDSIEVQDNGLGISPSNYESVALKHHTSKLAIYSDLDTLQTFGFRGEALSSLCALSQLSIVTCLAADVPKGAKLEFEPSGRLSRTSMVAAKEGTTVTVENLFHNLPVRRRELERNIKREWNKVLALLNQYACIQVGLKFTVSQQPNKGKRVVLFSTKGNPTTRENIINVFGAKTINALVNLNLQLAIQPTASSYTRDDSKHLIRVLGHVSRPVGGEGRQTPDRQMFYVNGRPCGLPQVAKVFNDVYKSYNSAQSPFIFADIQLDTHLYDVNVSPDKRTILLHEQSRMLESLRESLVAVFEAEDYTVPVAQLYSKNVTQKRTFPNSQDESYRGVATQLSSDPDGTTEEPTHNNPVDACDEDEVDTRAHESSASPSTRRNDKTPENVANDFIGRWVERKRYASSLREMGMPPATSTPNVANNTSQTKSPLASPEISGSEGSATSEYPAQSGPRKNSMQGRIPDLRGRESSNVYLRTGSNKPDQEGFENEELCPPSSASATRLPSDNLLPIPLSQILPGQERPVDGISATRVDCCAVSSDSDNSPRTKKSRTVSNVQQTWQLSSPGKESMAMPPLPFASRSIRMTRPAHFDGSDLPLSPGPSLAVKKLRPDLHAQTGSDLPEATRLDQASNQPTVSQVNTILEPASETVISSPLQSIDEEQSTSQSPHSALHGNVIVAQSLEDVPALRGVDDMPVKDNLKRKRPALTCVQKLKSNEQSIRSRIAVWRRQTSEREGHTNGDGYGAESDVENAEEKLSLIISKDDFSSMRIVGQFNKGFIIAVRHALDNVNSESYSSHRDDELFIIDQHASDEKYNFERLQERTVIESQPLVRPKRLELNAIEEGIILDNVDIFSKNGFEIEIDDADDYPVGSRCQLLALPLSRETTFGLSDLEELIAILSEDHYHDTSVVPRPSKVRSMFAMRACRSSVMIGADLAKSQMEKLVRHMGELDKPWNCPHGRPTMRHLTGLGIWSQRGWSEGKRNHYHYVTQSQWADYMKRPD